MIVSMYAFIRNYKPIYMSTEDFDYISLYEK